MRETLPIAAANHANAEKLDRRGTSLDFHGALIR
jgi:hypothetical protein